MSQLQEFRAYIQRHSDDPDFRLGDVAVAFGLSERYVRRVFSASEETPSAYLRKQRLDRAARMLRDPACAHLTILDVALECGFNHPSHFSRCFSEQLDASPRAWRKTPGGYPRDSHSGMA